MFWNRIFEDPRPDDTIGEHELPMTRRTGASDNVSLVACGNGRWA
jgi:hypothetical protein